MPHPALDLHDTIPAPYTGWYWRPDEGWVQYMTSSQNFREMRYVRPPSVNSPRRVDHTRAPTNWVARGGRVSCGHVEVVADFSDSYKERASGFLESPLTGQLGDILEVRLSQRAENTAKALSEYTKRSVQLNTALREVGSTARMVGNAATATAKGLDAFMSRNFKQLGRMSSWKKLPGKYLEWLYGWKPLSDDVSQAFLELAGIRDAGYELALTLRAKSRIKQQQVLSRSQFQGWWDLECTYDVEQRDSCAFVFSLPPWFFDELPVVSPFGNFYEQMPWSFVLDWFLPMGNWIGAVESMQLAPFFKEGSEATVLRRELQSARLTSAWDGLHRFLKSAQVSSSDYLYSRSAVDSLYLVAFRLPSLRKPLSLDHAAQGLALLTQVFKKWG